MRQCKGVFGNGGCGGDARARRSASGASMRRRRTAEVEDSRKGHERLGCTSKIRSPFDVRTITRASQQPARVAWRLPERHVSECAVTRRSRVLRGMVDLLLHDSNRTLIAANERRLARRVPQREIRIRGPRIVAVGVLVLSLAGCGRDNGEKQTAGTAATSEALAATPGFARQSAPYTARTLDSIGRATGTVEIEGAPPSDSVVQPASDQAVCGVSITHRSLERRGNRAVGVVVWIDGIPKRQAVASRASVRDRERALPHRARAAGRDRRRDAQRAEPRCRRASHAHNAACDRRAAGDHSRDGRRTGGSQRTRADEGRSARADLRRASLDARVDRACSIIRTSRSREPTARS